jgi:hypothetical protein
MCVGEGLHEEPLVVAQIVEFANDMAKSKFMPLVEKAIMRTKKI